VDYNPNDTQVFSSERETNPRRILVCSGSWRAYELELTADKIKWLWDEMSHYRSLFNDLTRGDITNFCAVMTLEDSFWLEVTDQEDNIVGLIYWTNMSQVIDTDAHVMFFDRKPAEKVALCREAAKYFFLHNPQCNRMTATLPIIYHASIRLAKKIGFRQEGVKRQSQLMGHKYVDEVIFGLLASEIL
jgi:Acetyltransferases, including N-acetylases of ribosomal proteins